MGSLKNGRRFDLSLTLILSLIIGVMLLVWPIATSFSVIKIVGFLLLISGIVSLVSYLASPVGVLRVAGGVIIIVIGIVFIAMPGAVIWLISALIGILLLIHGYRDFKIAQTLQEQRVLAMAVAIVTIVLAVLLIVNAFAVWSIGLRLVGIALIIDALGDLFLGVKSKGFNPSEPIDVEYREK
ncbi:MAG: DUF308 domain-containing protein [Eubacterium sp.]|nr:DUF308 domain-containing protein [Eubacterium sp.]